MLPRHRDGAAAVAGVPSTVRVASVPAVETCGKGVHVRVVTLDDVEWVVVASWEAKSCLEASLVIHSCPRSNGVTDLTSTAANRDERASRDVIRMRLSSARAVSPKGASRSNL